jgi:hypothetical protein
MVHVPGARAVATAALLLAVAGCSGDGNDPAASGSPTPSSPSTTAAASSIPTPPSESQVASEAASEVVRKYFAVVDHLRERSASPLSGLSTVATSTQRSALKTLLDRARQQGRHQTGATKIAVLQVQSVNLDNSDPSAGKVPTVQVDVCVDVSDVDILDKAGKSTVSQRRPDTGWTRFTVANYHWSSHPKDGWRVATGEDLKKAPCEPA